MIPINEYMTLQTDLPPYLPYPRFLSEMNLTLTAKLVYSLLLDRTTLSQKNGWVDEAGHIYVVFTLDALSQSLGRSTMTVKKALNELENIDLIERIRHGFSSPKRIFVKLPPLGQKSFPVMDRNLSVTGKENCPSLGKKTVRQRERKLSPNNLSINDLRDNDLNRAREGDAPSPCGRYENVLLTQAELKALQTELPSEWEPYIERLSEYMASTGKRYKNHLATLRRWAASDARKDAPKTRIPDYTCKEGESL